MTPEKRRNSREKPPSKALKSPPRYRSVSLCSQRSITASEFARRMGISPSLANYYLREMTKERYLFVSDVDLVKGQERHHYGAERQALLVEEEFAKLSPEERFGITDATLAEFALNRDAALEAGTFKNRNGRHLCCVDLKLSAEGWTALMTALLCVFKTALEIEVEASIRLRHSGAEPSLTTVALAGFESPVDPLGKAAADAMRRFSLRSRMALERELLDGRVDSHLTWIPLVLDERGRVELYEELRWLRICAYEIVRRSAVQLRRSREAPVHTTFAAFSFEGPPGVQP